MFTLVGGPVPCGCWPMQPAALLTVSKCVGPPQPGLGVTGPPFPGGWECSMMDSALISLLAPPSPSTLLRPCSAANVKKWEIELQTLRESNARLTTALQESAASVEQWKKQFFICRDENDQLRHKVGLRDPSRPEGRWAVAEVGQPAPPLSCLALPASHAAFPHRQEKDLVPLPLEHSSISPPSLVEI